MPPRSIRSKQASNRRPDAPSSSSRFKSADGIAAARLAAIIWGLWVLELALAILLPHGFLHDNESPLGVRLLLLSYTTVVLITLVGILHTVAILVLRPEQGRSRVRRWQHFCLKAAVAALLFYYVLSWATFWQVGKFLNWDAVRFWMIQPLQIFHWVDVDVGVAVIAATFVVGFAVLHWLPRWSADWSPAARSKLVNITKTTFGVSISLALLGEIYGGRAEQTYLRPTTLFLRARDDRSTPIAHVFGNIRAVMARRPEAQRVEPAKLIQREIIPIEKYLAAVDRGKFKPLNVIVIIVESLRADQLRAYGSGRDVMPAVEWLARDSRVFLDARSQSSQTSYAVLTPLSSHFPLRSAAQYAYPENPSYPRTLIHDVLKKLGYRTAVFSSSNENWEGMIHYLQTGNIDKFFHASVFKGPTYLLPGDTFFGNWAMTTRHAGSVDDRFTMDEAIQWIDRSADKPFFMYLNLQNSHVPYRVPEGFPRRFGPKETDFTIRFGHFPKDRVDTVKDLYADSLAYVDAQIGRLFDHLRKIGSWEKTAIVVTGDHGQAFYEHGFAAHGGPIFDEVMKVPLIIRAPGLTPALDQRPAQHVDVPPSVLEVLGLPPHPSFQGKSLLGPHSHPNKSIFMVAQTPLAYQYGIVQSHWKLIYDERQQDYFLFNLAADPGEANNLAAQEKSTVKRLADRLHAWRTTQIRYYTDSSWYSREYPPILED
jgi:arylsulfatase A-like enzyme